MILLFLADVLCADHVPRLALGLARFGVDNLLGLAPLLLRLFLRLAGWKISCLDSQCKFRNTETRLHTMIIKDDWNTRIESLKKSTMFKRAF